MFTKNVISQSMIDAVSKIIETPEIDCTPKFLEESKEKTWPANKRKLLLDKDKKETPAAHTLDNVPVITKEEKLNELDGGSKNHGHGYPADDDGDISTKSKKIKLDKTEKPMFKSLMKSANKVLAKKQVKIGEGLADDFLATAKKVNPNAKVRTNSPAPARPVTNPNPKTNGGGDYPGSPKSQTTRPGNKSWSEEVEPISELSKKTLKSYISGAKWDHDYTTKTSIPHAEKEHDNAIGTGKTSAWKNETDYLKKHAAKRSTGIGKAVMKIISKESVINELENHVSVNELPGNMHKTNPRTKTVDSLRGREKAPKDFHNKHISYKVELESGSAVAEAKDTDPPFDGGHKSPKEHKDSTGNTIKHFAKHLAKRGMAAAQKKSEVKEEVEGLSELSKSTLGSYAKKNREKSMDLTYSTTADDLNKKQFGDAVRKMKNRDIGHNKAIKRLTKEHKGPDAGDTFATNDNTSSSPSPLKLAKDLAQSSFKKIRKETMGDK